MKCVFDKYGIESDTWEKVMLEFIKKHKYLPLIYSMQRTRGDWSNGFGLVEDALNDFYIENELDEMIYADIRDCSYYEDGRIFRDCECNYNVLKRFLPNELAKDFDELYSKVIEELY